MRNFFVNFSLNKNNEMDNTDIIINFKNVAKCVIILSNSDISKTIDQ